MTDRRHRMKWTLGLGVIAAAQIAAAASSWDVTWGGAYVATEGVRSYEVPAYKLRQNDRRQVGAGFVRVGYALGDRWNAGLAYARYGELRGSGESWNTDLYDRGGVSFPMVVPLEIVDRLQEVSMDVRWRWALAGKVSLEAGPVFSWFHSSAELGTASMGTDTLGGPLRRMYSRIAGFRADDFRWGGTVQIGYAFSPRWSAQLGYRYAAPPARTLHLGSVAISRRL